MTAAGERERERALEEAGWNVFNLPASAIEFDLLTDVPDRVHARYRVSDDEADDATGSWEALGERARAVFGDARFVFFQKGRSGENALAAALLRGRDRARILSNGLFRTTARALTVRGAAVEVCPSFETGSSAIDVDWLAAELGRGDVAAVYLEVANNSLGGWPITAGHVAQVRELCDRHGAVLALDLARLLTNGVLLGVDADHARAVAASAHCFVASLAKEFSVPIGALVGVRDADLQQAVFLHGFEEGSLLEPLAMRCAVSAALAGTIADPSAVRARVDRVAALAAALRAAGSAVIEPVGGHGVFLAIPGPPATLDGCFELGALLYRVAGVRATITPTSRWQTSMIRLAVPLHGLADGIDRVATGVARCLAERERAPRLQPTSAPALHPTYFRRFALRS